VSLAWIVSGEHYCGDHGESHVAYGDTAIDAARALDESRTSTFTALDGDELAYGVTVKRAEQWDHLAPDGPTLAMRLADGWWQTCSECEHEVHVDGCETCAEERDTGEPGGSPMRDPVVRGDAVFCDTACLRKWEARHAARERRAQMAAHRAIERWPFITVTRADGNVYVGRELGAVVTFTFDGNREGAWADGKPDVTRGERPTFRFHNVADEARWHELAGERDVAWEVRYDDPCDDPACEIAYARTPLAAVLAVQARVDGDLTEFGEVAGHVTVKRSPQWDADAPDGPDDVTLLAAGWCVACAGCSGHADPDSDDAPYVEGKRVWCSAECHVEHVARMVRHAAAIEAARARYPFAEKLNARDTWRDDVRVIAVDFKFGDKHGTTWYVGDGHAEVDAAGIDEWNRLRGAT
jgi:hypothetical protein